MANKLNTAGALPRHRRGIVAENRISPEIAGFLGDGMHISSLTTTNLAEARVRKEKRRQQWCL